MDARSEAALATVDPALAAKVRAAAAKLEAVGTFILVVSGLRSAAEQDALYAQGGTKPGHIVTKAKAGQSTHNYGLAVDVVPYLSGQTGALNWHGDTEQFKAMVTALKAEGLTWGGDWLHFKDEDHFQLSTAPATPSGLMISDYGAGDHSALAVIWTNFGDGKYA